MEFFYDTFLWYEAFIISVIWRNTTHSYVRSHVVCIWYMELMHPGVTWLIDMAWCIHIREMAQHDLFLSDISSCIYIIHGFDASRCDMTPSYYMMHPCVAWLIPQWYDAFMSVLWCIDAWHDSFRSGILLCIYFIHGFDASRCDMTHLYQMMHLWMCHTKSPIIATWYDAWMYHVIFHDIRDMTHPCVTWLISRCHLISRTTSLHSKRADFLDAILCCSLLQSDEVCWSVLKCVALRTRRIDFLGFMQWEEEWKW